MCVKFTCLIPKTKSPIHKTISTFRILILQNFHPAATVAGFSTAAAPPQAVDPSALALLGLAPALGGWKLSLA